MWLKEFSGHAYCGSQAVCGGHDCESEFDVPIELCGNRGEASFLWDILSVGQKLCHDHESRYDCPAGGDVGVVDGLEQAIDAEADIAALGSGFDMDIGGVLLQCLIEQQIDLIAGVRFFLFSEHGIDVYCSGECVSVVGKWGA